MSGEGERALARARYWLKRAVRVRLGSIVDADDLLQEGALAVLEGRSVSGAMIDAQRRADHTRGHLCRVDMPDDLPAPEPDQGAFSDAQRAQLEGWSGRKVGWILRARGFTYAEAAALIRARNRWRGSRTARDPASASAERGRRRRARLRQRTQP